MDYNFAYKGGMHFNFFPFNAIKSAKEGMSSSWKWAKLGKIHAKELERKRFKLDPAVNLFTQLANNAELYLPKTCIN